MTRPLNVKLISFTEYPMGTLFYVWEQSRSNDLVPTPDAIEKLLNSPLETVGIDTEIGEIAMRLGGKQVSSWVDVKVVRDRVQATVDQILDEDIPCTENITFVFAIENMSISLREQMVRHRIGVTIGDRTGIDIIPEIPKSSWWSQTMRMLPMGRFFSEGRFLLPESLEGKAVELDKFALPYTKSNVEWVGKMPAKDLYLDLMAQIEFVYNKLIDAGVAMEDARQIIPIGATHSITWSINLKALMHIVGKRACWVAQANLWEAMISGMVNELCDKVSPRLRKIILPPCFKKGKYSACPYFQINRERVQGRDHMPPCPLFVYHQTSECLSASVMSVQETGQSSTWKPPKVDASSAQAGITSRNIEHWSCTEEVERRMLVENKERFERLWRLNVTTGEVL